MALIHPTVGRRVWYWPAANDKSLAINNRLQPCDAGIAFVWNDALINVSVADHSGNMHSRTSVRLLQEGEHANAGEAYAQWMPYQTGQAKAAADTPASSAT